MIIQHIFQRTSTKQSVRSTGQALWVHQSMKLKLLEKQCQAHFFKRQLTQNGKFQVLMRERIQFELDVLGELGWLMELDIYLRVFQQQSLLMFSLRQKFLCQTVNSHGFLKTEQTIITFMLVTDIRFVGM